jgi:hypothetical protein
MLIHSSRLTVYPERRWFFVVPCWSVYHGCHLNPFEVTGQAPSYTNNYRHHLRLRVPKVVFISGDLGILIFFVSFFATFLSVGTERQVVNTSLFYLALWRQVCCMLRFCLLGHHSTVTDLIQLAFAYICNGPPSLLRHYYCTYPLLETLFRS